MPRPVRADINCKCMHIRGNFIINNSALRNGRPVIEISDEVMNKADSEPPGYH